MNSRNLVSSNHENGFNRVSRWANRARYLRRQRSTSLWTGMCIRMPTSFFIRRPLEAGVIVDRIFFSPAAPQDRPWMWASGHNGDIRRAAHRYEPTRIGRGGPDAASSASGPPCSCHQCSLIIRTGGFGFG
jgi:hypothetical protein